MSFGNPVDSITIPNGASPAEPQVYIGQEVPPELVEKYGAGNVIGVVIYRFDADRYNFTAILRDKYFLLVRVEGSVNNTRPTVDRVTESLVFDVGYSSVLTVKGPVIFDNGNDDVQFNSTVYSNHWLYANNLNATRLNVEGAATAWRNGADCPIVTGPKGALGRVHWWKGTVSTDASGLATVTHGAGFVPSAITISQNGVTGSGVGHLLTVNGTETANTVQIKCMNASGGVAAVNVGVTLACYS